MKTKKKKGAVQRRRNFVHAIIDLWIPDIRQLNIARITNIIREAARVGQVHVVTIKSHRFGPSAFTIFALLSESHIAVHTWPEYEYVACDIFSCGGKPQQSIRHFIKSLSPKGIAQYDIARSSPNMLGGKSQYMDGTGPGIRTLFDVRKLHIVRSRYQVIQVLSHRELGRMFVINDDVQFTERDHALYDKALLSPIKKTDAHEDILVVGGGDGLCCTYLLENQLAKSITLLELDPTVMEVCKKYFPRLSRGLNSDKVSIECGDATETIRSLPNSSFDVVVLDSTAPDTKWGNSTYSIEFFREIQRVLRPGGKLCANGTSIWFEYAMSAELIASNISTVFGEVSTSTEWIPSFGSPWAFLCAVKR